MNLENSIKDVIGKKLEDGTIEKLIEQELEKGVVNALDSLFRSYGDVTKVIEEKVKSVMVPYLEGYDYSRYIVKLDSVLVDVLKSTSLENKKLLSNFKKLIVSEEVKEVMTTTELFDKWMDYVATNVKTDGLEVNYEDSPSYEYVDVTYDFEQDERRSSSNLESGVIAFECEHDEEMNFEIKLYRWKDSKDKTWTIDYKTNLEINSLRHLNEFEIFLMNLHQAGTKIEIDTLSESGEIEPKAVPEASWS